MFCSLYLALCRRYGPGGLTFSASAHLRAMAGRPWARNRIDGLWLLLFGVHGHCQQQWQKESRSKNERTMP